MTTREDLKTQTTPQIPPPVVEALEAILASLWEEEQRHYEENPTPTHLFLALRQVREWLDRQR